MPALPYVPPRLLALLVAFGLLSLAACDRFREAPPPAADSALAVDTTRVAPLQRGPLVLAPPRTAETDTVQARPRSAPFVTPATALAEPTTEATPVPRDSLLALLADMQATLTALEQRLDTVDSDQTVQGGAPPALATADSGLTAAADTAAAGVGQRLQQTAQGVRNLGISTLAAFMVALVTYLIIRSFVWMLDLLAERSATRRLMFKKLVPIVRILLWGVALYYIVAGIYQPSREQLVAVAAALGFAVGFAGQNILQNIFGGLIIIFDQPFQVGDKISVGGTYGEVVSIGLRSTRIVTPDDNLVSVPNAQVVDGQVSNANAGALDCQVVTDLYVPGWADAALAKRIAFEAAANSRFVYLDKPIVVNVKDVFDGTFLTNLKVKAYVLDTRYEFALMSDVTETAKAEFRKHGLLTPLSPVMALGGDGPETPVPPPQAPSTPSTP
ncbi:MAG: mechanosensitive ion channel family protein [Bacteroidota bacterium]